jgi:hypothetical protein
MPTLEIPEPVRDTGSSERSRAEVLAAARALRPYEDAVIDDLTDEEARTFLAAILEE